MFFPIGCLSACLSLVDNHFCQMVRYVQERKEQLRVATACHVDPTSGHMGVKKNCSKDPKGICMERHSP